MITFLTAVSGIAWTIVYVAVIRIGFTQQTYALPVMALALNIAWESIYSVWGISTDPGLQAGVNVVWALADLVIVHTFLRFGRRELPPFVTRGMFCCWAVGVFATAYVVQWAFVVEFGYAQAARYTAFLQNLLMSVLFIAMFVGRRGPRGQSMTIAIAKWLGTLAPTIVFGVYEHSAFILPLGALCSVVDLAYIALLAQARRDPARFGAGVPRELVHADRPQ
ncbi:transmembrane-type terpene cyclase [Modestobacter excelsi]|uniref:transmembrane-type terpene cyclase n=1 Tax=Modestobacter excelsi TaxID=2213161 RepID=UPI00110C9710|nr:hypothetical protein [Modestobacter excelsi]